MQYALSISASMSFEDAITRVTEELQREGFGVLTSIDVKETMKKKLGLDFPNYIILGACNPTLAHQALLAEEQIGLLLPCNVIVYEREGETIVAAFDPQVMVSVLGHEGIEPIAEEVRQKLERVLRRIAPLQVQPGNAAPGINKTDTGKNPERPGHEN